MSMVTVCFQFVPSQRYRNCLHRMVTACRLKLAIQVFTFSEASLRVDNKCTGAIRRCVKLASREGRAPMGDPRGHTIHIVTLVLLSIVTAQMLRGHTLHILYLDLLNLAPAQMLLWSHTPHPEFCSAQSGHCPNASWSHTSHPDFGVAQSSHCPNALCIAYAFTADSPTELA